MSPKNARISTKGWSLDSLVSSSGNFHAADRVPASSSELSQVIKDHERKGVPLVIEGLHRHENWPAEMFTIEGFEEHSNSKEISVRNVHSWTDKVMNFSDFISQSRHIGPFAEEAETERLYGKDAECPRAWDKWLQEGGVLPLSTLSHGQEDEFRFRPASSRIETLMCYLGVGDTYTPCHKDLCASSGQNLMCYTEKNGSSFWFMTEGSSAPKASAYFHNLGQELDHENHVITLEQMRRAPFKVHILEQRLGDLVLVPPRSCHQVVNYGGITLKTSWSRMTLKGLSTAYHHELPIYRRVGRPETYRIKSTIYYALRSRIHELETQLTFRLAGSTSGLDFSQELANAINSTTNNQPLGTPNSAGSELDILVKDLVQLLHLYDLILEEERPGPELKTCRPLESSFNDDSRIVCDFCECDIFQSFFECSRCMGGGCIICPGCYSEGRTCKCETMQPMQPMQCREFQTLIDTQLKAVDVLQRLEKTGDKNIYLNDRHKQSAPRLFEAACLLFQTRKDQRVTRTCSKTSHYDSHAVPFAWGLHCLQCHRSTCFRHLLKQCKMHSAEAILLFNGDESRVEYHRKHQLSSKRYGDSLLDVEKSQRDGSPTNGHVLLAHITSEYIHPLPLNWKSLQLGWYDVDPEERGLSEREDAAKNQPKLTITIPSRRKRFPATQFRDSESQVYIEVPPAPYPIPRKRRRISDATTKSPEEVQSRPVDKKPDSSTSFKGRQILASPQLTRSTSLPVDSDDRIPRTPQHTKRVRVEPVSPQKYLDSQVAKKALYNRLHFTKTPCPKPDDNTSAMILAPDLPDGNINSNPPFVTPPRREYSHHPPAQFTPPQEELAHSALEFFKLIGAASSPEEFDSHHTIPSAPFQTSQEPNDPFFPHTESQ